MTKRQPVTDGHLVAHASLYMTLLASAFTHIAAAAPGSKTTLALQRLSLPALAHLQCAQEASQQQLRAALDVGSTRPATFILGAAAASSHERPHPVELLRERQQVGPETRGRVHAWWVGGWQHSGSVLTREAAPHRAAA